ncbi:MAG: hypothetical protein VXZ72_01470 [Chlamydiota bacterium]|nr:hypothetical protein [Chlamydiota bacterium]
MKAWWPLFFLLVGCSSYRSPFLPLAVSQVIDDEEGHWRESLVRGVIDSYGFSYCEGKEGYQLEGRLIQEDFFPTGYQYDRNPRSGQRINRLIANEGEKRVTLGLTIKDSRGRVVSSEEWVTASWKFDWSPSFFLEGVLFDMSGKEEEILDFSLGQLEDAVGASQGALSCLQGNLAERVSRYLNDALPLEEG